MDRGLSRLGELKSWLCHLYLSGLCAALCIYKSAASLFDYEDSVRQDWPSASCLNGCSNVPLFAPGPGGVPWTSSANPMDLTLKIFLSNLTACRDTHCCHLVIALISAVVMLCLFFPDVLVCPSSTRQHHWELECTTYFTQWKHAITGAAMWMMLGTWQVNPGAWTAIQMGRLPWSFGGPKECKHKGPIMKEGVEVSEEMGKAGNTARSDGFQNWIFPQNSRIDLQAMGQDICLKSPCFHVFCYSRHRKFMGFWTTL